MLKMVLNPEEFDDLFSEKITKWKMLDYVSGNDINVFPFVSLQPAKLTYVIKMIIEGENPFVFYDEMFNMQLKDFEDFMQKMDKKKTGHKYLKNNIEIPKDKVNVYAYNLQRYIRQKDILGGKIKNKITVTSLDFVEYSTMDRAYLLPVMKMTFVQPSAVKSIKLEDITSESGLCINQYENTFIISHIHAKPTEIKII